MYLEFQSPHDMIDLRSDTVTTPTSAMRRAMANAVVGDDVFHEDPTVNALQERVADLFGKQDALFVTSGCLGNQIALALHAGAGDEVIVESESHIFHYETGAPSIIARVQLRCVDPVDGTMQLDDLTAAVRPGAYYYARTKLVCVENTHNRHGGTVLSLDYIEKLDAWRRKRKLALHCDGARIWNASTATGVALHEYGKHFDTMSVCLSKALGAPIGSMIVGTHAQITEARRWRKLLGGGMRQVGVLAAAGLYALEHHREHLASDHAHAAQFASALHSADELIVDNYPTQTNIVVFRTRRDIEPSTFIDQCAAYGLRVSSGREGGWLRAVFHHQVTKAQAKKAAEIIRTIALENASTKSKSAVRRKS